MPSIIFIIKDGTEKTIAVDEGTTVLSAAEQNDIDLHGACQGSLACATCHVIVDEKDYAKFPAPTQTEEEMLDFAFGATPTSRLACQLTMTKELDGIRVKLPSASRNL